MPGVIVVQKVYSILLVQFARCFDWYDVHWPMRQRQMCRGICSPASSRCAVENIQRPGCLIILADTIPVNGEWW